MRDPHEVVVAPVVTEKSSRQMEEENVFTFIVHKGANKIEIGRAVEALWDVKVKDVRTMRYNGKMRRSFMGRLNQNYSLGRRPSFKKALVRLQEGDHIELYEAG